MGVILHRRLLPLPVGLALAALAATPAAAQAPAEREPEGAFAGAQQLAGGVLAALPPAVGGTLEDAGVALEPAEISEPGADPPAPPTEEPAPTEPAGGEPTGQEQSPAGDSPAHAASGFGADAEPQERRSGDTADEGAWAGGSAPGGTADVSAPASAAAVGGRTSGSGESAGRIAGPPSPRAHEAGAFERIVSVVPWPVYAALGLMGALLALSTLRSHRYRRRLMEAEMEAKTDGLTGLPNRLDAERFLDRVVAGSARSGRQLSIALVDLDHFKAINDEFGHAAGDATLRGVAHALRSELRASDHVGRLGGEEFLVILPDAGTEEALAVAERIRERIAAMPRRVDRRVTASLGVATLPGDACSATELTAAADRALYAAKEAGRDRIVWAGALDSPRRRAAVSA